MDKVSSVTKRGITLIVLEITCSPVVVLMLLFLRVIVVSAEVKTSDVVGKLLSVNGKHSLWSCCGIEMDLQRKVS